eukprot:m.272751 g.272751  ORF g.272751 m.272751 type:complete len:279 (+) comp17680_c0_seq8:1009-1845(+)
MPPFIAGLQGKRCAFCAAFLWDNESDSLCCDGGKVKVPVLPYRVPEPLTSLLAGLDQTRSNLFRGSSAIINNALAVATATAKWIWKVGDHMPSTVNVQGQVQASIPHIPDLGEAGSVFQIQSAFFQPDDPRHNGHIAPGTADNVQSLIGDLYAVLRNLNNPIYRTCESAVMHAQALYSNGFHIPHFELVPHENGNYIYSTEITQSSAGQLIDSALIGTELGGARILQALTHELPLVDNDDVLQPTADVPPNAPNYWPSAYSNPPTGAFQPASQHTHRL